MSIKTHFVDICERATSRVLQSHGPLTYSDACALADELRSRPDHEWANRQPGRFYVRLWNDTDLEERLSA